MADAIDCKPKLASDVPVAIVDSASKSKPVLKPPLSNAEHISDGLVLNSCTNVTINVGTVGQSLLMKPTKWQFPWSLSLKKNKKLKKERKKQDNKEEE